MDQRFRQRNSVPMKGMTSSARLDMSTVFEDHEELNETTQITDESPNTGSVRRVSNQQQMTMSANFNPKTTESKGHSEEIVSERSSDLSSDREEGETRPFNFTPRDITGVRGQSFGPVAEYDKEIPQLIKKSTSLSSRFSRPINIEESFRDNDVRGQEIIISRKINMLDSQLLSYFQKRVKHSNTPMLFQDESLSDGPKFRVSYFNQESFRGRSTTAVLDPKSKSYDANQSWTPSSPTGLSTASGTFSTKSERQNFETLKQTMEINSRKLSRQSSFSAFVQQQLQKQLESNYLRKATRKIRQLQIFVKEQEEKSSSSSEVEEEKPLKKSELSIQRPRRLPTIGEENTALLQQSEPSSNLVTPLNLKFSTLLNHLDTIQERATNSPQKFFTHSIKQSERLLPSPSSMKQSILIPNAPVQVIEQRKVTKTEQMIRSGMFAIREGVVKLFDQARRQQAKGSLQSQDNYHKLKLLVCSSILGSLLLTAVFFLALIKYGINKY